MFYISKARMQYAGGELEGQLPHGIPVICLQGRAPSFPLVRRSRSVFDSTSRRLVSLILPRRSHTNSSCAAFDTTLEMRYPVRCPRRRAPVGEIQGSLEGCVPIKDAIFSLSLCSDR